MHELLESLRAGELVAFAVFADETINPIAFQIPDRYGEAVLFDVKGQILAHHTESDHTELCGRCACLCR